MAILNLNEFNFFRAYPWPKWHILLHSIKMASYLAWFSRYYEY